MIFSNFSRFLLLPALFVAISVIAGCNQSQENDDRSANAYPAAEGFNAMASDSQATALADSVMKAMGGYDSWAKTNVIQWNFFGRRTHTWSKQSGRDSIDIPGKNLVIDMNIRSKEGNIFKNGQELTQPDSVQKYLQQGYEMWVNDMYWLLMPYKLKDSGVTITYAGLDSMQTGEMAHKINLTFDSVGVTPQNMYYVWIDTTEHLVRQWAYFSEAKADTSPGFILPWNEYQQHGDILLSGDRGKFQISDLRVMETWPGTE